MKKINELVLGFTIAIIDYLYRGRHFQRFWVLEEIARAPYFAFLSVLHFRESLGLRGQWHLHLMKEHFAQTVNETEHLEYMESRGGNSYWIDRFFARHLVLVYYWINVVYYWLAPRAAYHLSYEIELHAAETYAHYLAYEDWNDKKIWEIMNDEIQHFQELQEAIRIIDPDYLTVREKSLSPLPESLEELLK
jgi:ubiquinol oxidase